jgi:hypothetical protein
MFCKECPKREQCAKQDPEQATVCKALANYLNGMDGPRRSVKAYPIGKGDSVAKLAANQGITEDDRGRRLW